MKTKKIILIAVAVAVVVGGGICSLQVLRQSTR